MLFELIPPSELEDPNDPGVSSLVVHEPGDLLNFGLQTNKLAWFV